MSLTLATYPRDAAALRRVARPVREDEFGSPALVEFAQGLFEIASALGALGIAATQVLETPLDPVDSVAGAVGSAPIAMILLRIDDQKLAAFCNPKIERRLGSKPGFEGCLSFASVGVKMDAPELVEMSYRTPRGTEGSVVLEGIRARCAVHECEHLQGRTMLDRMSPMKRAHFLRDVARVRGRAS
jgi:peptide deformylase